jgi:hypothetical protein
MKRLITTAALTIFTLLPATASAELLRVQIAVLGMD